jgi:hypothetical protein
MNAAAPLTFDAPTHTYRVGERVLPSVTQILDPLQYLDGIPWAVLEAARKFGDHVHQAVHLWNIGKLDEPALDPHLAPYLLGWKRFIGEAQARVILSEHRMVHRRLGYAGTLDSVVRIAGRNHVCDVKSGVLPKTVGMQTAAYRHAYLSEGTLTVSPVRYCVQLVGDGLYRLHKLNDATDLNYFLSALNINVWRSRNGRSH